VTVMDIMPTLLGNMENELELRLDNSDYTRYVVVPKTVTEKVRREISYWILSRGEKYCQNPQNRKEIVSMLLKNVYEEGRLGALYNMNKKYFKKLVYIELSKINI